MNAKKLTVKQRLEAVKLMGKYVAWECNTRPVHEITHELDRLDDRPVAYEAMRLIEQYVASAKWEYAHLNEQLSLIEKKHSDSMNGVFVYLQDPMVDEENVLVNGMTEFSIGFWPAMCAAQASAAGMRAEDLGLDLNKAVGRVVY